ncbi:DUF6101 family protein [Bradyrhizobium prioriisuperbiae]|uniref:DUF6101 family protein n=1 Tax=Bradyrhizobium prioriisuperbiae TaxID=2854389 RepID=UPI0028E7E163|nr:DUF6101 family protein [Bradyrhizobium prioritasuperba]
MRRQFGAGGTPAGSSRVLRLDPFSLPLRFDTRDARADGGMRQVEISRDRVVLRRAVRGMRMAINVRVNDFLGIAVREADDGQMLVLVHRDPSLSIPLLVSTDDTEIEQACDAWGEIFALPRISEDTEQVREPAPRRRRHNVIKTRRPRILMRRRNNRLLSEMAVHRDEREIVARD